MKKMISILTAAALVSTMAMGVCASEVSTLPVLDDTVPTLEEFVEAIKGRADEGPSGNLVIYSTSSEAENAGAKQMFEALYPNISVEIVMGGTGELTSRIEAEAANPQGDVMYGGLNQSSASTYEHLFEKYIPKGYENLREIYQTDQNMIWAYFDTSAVIINKSLKEDMGFEIATYDDLLNEDLKSWMISADPLASSSSRTWYLAALLAKGGIESEEGWAYVDGLMENFDGFLAAESSNAYQLPITGEYAVGLSYQAACLRAIADGGDVEYVVLSPTLTQGYGAAKIKDAPNSENAELFMDFLLSDEMQSYFSIVGLAPASETAPIYDPALAEAIGKVEALDVDWDSLGAQVETFKTLWAEHWAEHS